MGDDELSEIRKRRMAQLQQQAGQQQEELDQQQRLKQQMQMVLMQILEPDARERLNTIKLDKAGICRRRGTTAGGARPERASQAEDHRCTV